VPVLKNPKHEIFAQELAKGRTQIEAQQTAGYKPNDSNAAQLAKRPEIQARITEINGRVAAKAEITLESLLNEAAELQEKAAAANQFSAANGALKLKAELSGHYVQRKEDVTPRRSVREIDSRIHQLLAGRGQGGVVGTAGGKATDVGADADLPSLPGDGSAEAGAISEASEVLQSWRRSH
jgi:hypothetical protein